MTFRVATLPGICPDCRRNIRHGEIIVLVGTSWVHAVCAKVCTPEFLEWVGEMSDALVDIAFSVSTDIDDVLYIAQRHVFGQEPAEEMRANARRIRAMSPAERLDEAAARFGYPWTAIRDDPISAEAWIEART